MLDSGRLVTVERKTLDVCWDTCAWSPEVVDVRSSENGRQSQICAKRRGLGKRRTCKRRQWKCESTSGAVREGERSV